MLKGLFESVWKKALDSEPAIEKSVGGRDYLIKGNTVLPAFQEPHAEFFELGTLTGLVEYLTANKDKADLSTIMVHVLAPDEVSVISGYDGPWMERHQYAHAQTHPKEFAFEKFMSQEAFIIALQTYFEQTSVTADLAKFAGGVRLEDEASFMDNGIAQGVTVKTSVARVEMVDVPNPVTLAPYRTFKEVEQPASKFVFRMRRNGNVPEFALFEADGGNWQLEAMRRVKEWLVDNLPKDAGLVVLA